MYTRLPTGSTRLYADDRMVRGFNVRLFVQTKETRPEHQDYYGVYIEIAGSHFPCRVRSILELVHHDGLAASAVKRSVERACTSDTCWGVSPFIAKVCIASPGNNPYVRDGYVTFKCTFKIDGRA
jgi:hypothetical protein